MTRTGILPALAEYMFYTQHNLFEQHWTGCMTLFVASSVHKRCMDSLTASACFNPTQSKYQTKLCKSNCH
jgi:hypothetical protein